MHEDLIPFMQKIKNLGFLIKLDTNGTNPDLLKYVEENCLVDYIAMDIKAPLHKYAGTIARPVDIERIKKSIQLLINGGIPYEFRTTVVKALLSQNDFHQIGQAIKGASTYYLQRFVPTKLLNPAFIKKTTYSDEEFEGLRETMLEYVTECKVR